MNSETTQRPEGPAVTDAEASWAEFERTGSIQAALSYLLQADPAYPSGSEPS